MNDLPLERALECALQLCDIMERENVSDWSANHFSVDAQGRVQVQPAAFGGLRPSDTSGLRTLMPVLPPLPADIELARRLLRERLELELEGTGSTSLPLVPIGIGLATLAAPSLELVLLGVSAFLGWIGFTTQRRHRVLGDQVSSLRWPFTRRGHRYALHDQGHPPLVVELHVRGDQCDISAYMELPGVDPLLTLVRIDDPMALTYLSEMGARVQVLGEPPSDRLQTAVDDRLRRWLNTIPHLSITEGQARYHRRVPLERVARILSWLQRNTSLLRHDLT